MKNFKHHVIVSCFAFALLLVGCNKKESLSGPPINTPTENIQGEVDETYYYGQYHNDAVAFLIEEFEAEIESITEGDTAELIAFLIGKMETYYSTHPLVLNEEELDLPNLDYSSEMLNLFRNETQSVSPYLDSMISSITSEPSHSEIREYVDYAYQVALNDNTLEQSEKDIELAKLSMFKGSLDLWYNHPQVPQGKKLSLGLTDLCGAADGAFWGGAVAGPLGAVVIGINAGIIASSTAYILDVWW